MSTNIRKVIILGGGSAGWLSAGLIASTLSSQLKDCSLSVTLIESKEIGTIGVGEGTWPTMRSTLKTMGISESILIKECDASFKQASKFVNWTHNEHSNYYYHPFNPTQGYPETNIAPFWQANSKANKLSFSKSVSSQEAICELGLAPKMITTAEYRDVANYGYHFDSSKFSQMLKKHCINVLGVALIEDKVISVNKDDDGYITSLTTERNNNLEGDFFIDCSGFSSLLLGKALNVPFVNKQDTLFADSAVVTQIPYPSADASIPCYTKSSAQSSGWIWDIGLSSRKGIGYVYSSQYCDKAKAIETLKNYIGPAANDAQIKSLAFQAGHRKIFWEKNCVAIGLSAGFLEPLEASALMFIETSAAMLANNFPANRESMLALAANFNSVFQKRWAGVIDFLKLHYALSQRQEPFWRDNRQSHSIPASLTTLLKNWRYCPPSDDAASQFDVFRAPSYQYVLYGMGFKTDFNAIHKSAHASELAHKAFIAKNIEEKTIIQRLPQHRVLIDQIIAGGLSKI